MQYRTDLHRAVVIDAADAFRRDRSGAIDAAVNHQLTEIEMPTMHRRQEWRNEREAALHMGDFADTIPAPDGVDIDRAHRRTVARSWRNAFPGCAGQCQQGRKLCPCPDACQAAYDGSLDAPTGIVVALGIVGAIVAIVAALHWALT